MTLVFYILRWPEAKKNDVYAIRILPRLTVKEVGNIQATDSSRISNLNIQNTNSHQTGFKLDSRSYQLIYNCIHCSLSKYKYPEQ